MPELGLSFGNVAALYDRVRPSYMPESLDRAQEALELDASAHVLDLAAGTGRLTHELAQRFARVIAVEPDETMRAFIRDGEVLAGTAESIPLDEASMDAVFVAEALHWFDADRAVPEIARVLKPRGGFATISDDWWDTGPPLPKRALELLRVPWVASGRAEAVETWREAFERSGFEPLRDESFPWERTVDAETLLSMYQTTSSIAAMPAEEREAFVNQLRPLLEGPYVLPIRTELTWTRLTR